jgi:hypothetical protein
MSIKYGVFCIILAFLMLFLAIKSYEAWTHSVEVAPEKGTLKKSEAKVDYPPVTPVVKEPSGNKTYISIAEKNIFSPERKDFPVTAPGSGTSMRPMVRPQIILYGITLAKDYQSVSIVQPGRPLRKGERELMTLKVGERIGEYKLAKIFPDRITLEAEGDTFEVSLYDPGTPKRRKDVKTETKPASVTTTLPTPTSPSAASPKPPQESIQRPQEPIPGTITRPSPLPSPVRPSFPPASTVRGRRLYSPPSGSPTLPSSPVPPGTPQQEAEE